jgi:uncharacterized protein (TIGR00295 family)
MMSKLDMSIIPTEKHCLLLLKKNGASQKLIDRAKGVTALVKKLASRINVKREILIAGAMLHGIGKTRTLGMKRGFISGRILRDEGVDEAVVRIVECHVGVGIRKKEAVKLGLPPRDFVPKTIEEKLVCYADKLVVGTYVATPDEAKIEFASKLPPTHPWLKRWDKFMAEMKQILGEPHHPLLR